MTRATLVGVGLALAMGIAAAIGLRSAGQAHLRAKAIETAQADAWAAAAPLLDQALAAAPNDPELNMHRARVAVALDQPEAALAALARVPTGDAEFGVDARLREAELLLAGRFRGRLAEASLRQALAARPDSVDARRLLLFLFRLENRVQEAQPLFWQAIAKADTELRPRLLATWFLTCFAQWTEDYAGPKLRRFAANDPEDTHARVALAALRLRDKDWDGVAADLAALRLPPEHLHGRYFQGLCLAEMDRRDELAALLAEWPEAAREDPADGRYQRLAGMQALSGGDPAAAVVAFRRVLAAEPWDWRSGHRLALAYDQLGKAAHAAAVRADTARLTDTLSAEVVTQFVSRTVGQLDQGEARRKFGDLHAAVGMIREARAWYQAALDLDPADAAAKAALAKLPTGDRLLPLLTELERLDRSAPTGAGGAGGSR